MRAGIDRTARRDQAAALEARADELQRTGRPDRAAMARLEAERLRWQAEGPPSAGRA